MLAPHLSNVRSSRGGTCIQLFFVTIQNQQSDKHSHFTLWYTSCRRRKSVSNFSLFLSFFYTTICSILHVQHYECLPGEAVRKFAVFSPYLNIPTSLWWLARCQTSCEDSFSLSKNIVSCSQVIRFRLRYSVHTLDIWLWSDSTF